MKVGFAYLKIRSFMKLTLEYIEFGVFDSRIREIHKKTIPSMILVHSISGEYHIKINSQKWVIPVGVSFIIPPNVEIEFDHIPGPNGTMKSVWAHLTAIVDQAYDWADFFQLPAVIQGPDSLKIGYFLKQGLKIETDKIFIRESVASARAYDILSILSLALPEKQESHSHLNNIRLARLIGFIKKQFAQPLLIKDLARSVNLSRSHLHEMVKMTTGKTPHHLLLELRINEASKMLLRSNLKIEQVAMDCGFTCPFHFSRTFKSIKGIPPSLYREMNINSFTASK